MVELLDILSELEEFIEDSPRVPLSKKVMVDESRVLDFVDRIRTTLPDEVRQAKILIREREKVLSESRREAEKIMEDMQKQIEKKVDQSEITDQAQQKAKEIIKQAEKMAEEIRFGARDYAEDILQKIDSNLQNVILQINTGREELKKMK